MILYVAADLLWASRIKAESDANGVPARPVRSVEMLDARLADSDVRGLIVDLETGTTGLELIRRLRAAVTDRHVPIVAFGPHVATDALAEARRAGADRVMARGAFASQLPQILVRLQEGEAASGGSAEGAE